MVSEVCCCVVKIVSSCSSCHLVKAGERIWILRTLGFTLDRKVSSVYVSNATTNYKSDFSTPKMEVRINIEREWLLIKYNRKISFKK